MLICLFYNSSMIVDSTLYVCYISICWCVYSLLILWLWIVHCMYVIHHSDTRCWYVCSILILWLYVVHCMYVMHHSDTRCWYVCSILILWLCVVYCMYVYIIQLLFFTYSMIVNWMYVFKLLCDMFKQTAWKILNT